MGKQSIRDQAARGLRMLSQLRAGTHSFTSCLPLKQINCSETAQPEGQPSVIPHSRNASSCHQIWNCVQGYVWNLGRRLRFLRSQWSQEGHEPLPGQVVNLPILLLVVLAVQGTLQREPVLASSPSLSTISVRALGPGSSPTNHKFPFSFPLALIAYL